MESFLDALRTMAPRTAAAVFLVENARLVANTIVTFVGWWLWRQDIVHIDAGIGPKVVFDLVVLVFVMDLLMYLGHRVAHHRLVYPIVHRRHHRFVVPRPATLFALHPLEALGFHITIWDRGLGTIDPFSDQDRAGPGPT